MQSKAVISGLATLALVGLVGCSSSGSPEATGTSPATGTTSAQASGKAPAPGSAAPGEVTTRPSQASRSGSTGGGAAGSTGSAPGAPGAAPRGATAPSAALKPLGWRSGAFSGDTLAQHQEFGTWRGRPISSALWFMAQESWPALENPAYWAVEHLKDPAVTAVLSYAMWPAGLRGASLARGATGAYDKNWTRVAQNLVKDGLGDAIIRPGWEFNGDWYPWSLRNDQGAADFAAYWRHIVDAMRAVEGQQFRFSWNPVGSGGGVDPAKAYPGDAYVDDIGLDVYNAKQRPGLSSAALWDSQVRMRFGLAWQRAFAAQHRKPVSYPEWGAFSRPSDPASAGGDDPRFIREMFAWMKADPPSYENYFDHDTPQGTFYGLHTEDGVMPASAKAYKSLWGR